MDKFGEKVTFIWSVADLLRDAFKRSKYPDVILPLTVLRRLDCVLEPNKDKVLSTRAFDREHLPGTEPKRIDVLAVDAELGVTLSRTVVVAQADRELLVVRDFDVTVGLLGSALDENGIVADAHTKLLKLGLGERNCRRRRAAGNGQDSRLSAGRLLFLSGLLGLVEFTAGFPLPPAYAGSGELAHADVFDRSGDQLGDVRVTRKTLDQFLDTVVGIPLIWLNLRPP